MADNKSTMSDDITCPRQLFGHDLKILIEDFLRKGHQLLACDDFNSEYTELKEWMLNLTLANVIATKYGLGSKTYRRSRDYPIDHCFGSATLKIY